MTPRFDDGATWLSDATWADGASSATRGEAMQRHVSDATVETVVRARLRAGGAGGEPSEGVESR